MERIRRRVPSWAQARCHACVTRPSMPSISCPTWEVIDRDWVATAREARTPGAEGSGVTSVGRSSTLGAAAGGDPKQTSNSKHVIWLLKAKHGPALNIPRERAGTAAGVEKLVRAVARIDAPLAALYVCVIV